MRYATLMAASFLSMCLVQAAEIRGGTEGARFAPGDHALYQENFAGARLGSRLADWKILQGSYEVAEFQGRRWLRPLQYDTHLLKPLRLPADFSVEFDAYLSRPGGAVLRVFLHTAEEVERGPGPDGPAQLYLELSQQGERDGVRVLQYDASQRRWIEVLRRNDFPTGRPHEVGLQVRDGELGLFLDGTHLVSSPFRPQAPLTAIGFRFLSRSGHALPYKDRPALLGAIRIAGYSRPQGRAAGGAFLYWALPLPEEGVPSTLRAQNQTYNGSVALDSLRQRMGWRQATLLVVPLPDGTFDPQGRRVALSGAAAQNLVQALQKTLPEIRTLGGGLLIVGDGSDGATERERELLARQRATALAAWLAAHGIGDANALLSIVAENGGYEGIYFIADNGGYESIFY